MWLTHCSGQQPLTATGDAATDEPYTDQAQTVLIGPAAAPQPLPVPAHLPAVTSSYAAMQDLLGVTASKQDTVHAVQNVTAVQQVRDNVIC